MKLAELKQLLFALVLTVGSPFLGASILGLESIDASAQNVEFRQPRMAATSAEDSKPGESPAEAVPPRMVVDLDDELPKRQEPAAGMAHADAATSRTAISRSATSAATSPAESEAADALIARRLSNNELQATDDLAIDGATRYMPPQSAGPYEVADSYAYCPDDWGFHSLPGGLIYKSYLAGLKESRMAGKVVHSPTDSGFFDATLGARLGIWRYGNADRFRPRGFQMDVEASAQLRQDFNEELDVIATDYRVGVPLTWGNERQQFKLAWYHISSHLGDEFMLKNPEFPLFFQSSDFVVLGYSVYPTDRLRLYGEVGWAFKADARDPWEFQFGFEWAPRGPTGNHGAPFVAANAYLREELNFGGTFNFEAGWAWRSKYTAHLLRTGFHYHNGANYQYAFLPFHEELLGFGLWYDF